MLTARIARRYLRSRKSHTAVTAISVVSIIGVAVATAALVCVLSVFNGFHDLMYSHLSSIAPDVLIEPAKGKIIEDADALARRLSARSDVEIAMPSVTDQALAVYEQREMPVVLKGVDDSLFRRLTAINSLVLPNVGTFSARTHAVASDALDEYGLPMEGGRTSDAAISIGVASRLSVYDVPSPMLLFVPRQGARLNPANPLASFQRDSVQVCGVFQAQQSQYDADLVITDIATARDLFSMPSEASTAIEVKGRPGIDPARLAADLDDTLPPTYTVKDRLQQQEINFRMIQIEKWVTYLILFFILLIAGFNMISTLSMLILEKRSTLSTLHALGLTRERIGAIFAWESVYITAIGALAGIVVGIALCLVQEHFELIKLNGDEASLVIKSYPVAVHGWDIVMVCIPLALIALVTALTASAYARRKLREIRKSG